MNDGKPSKEQLDYYFRTSRKYFDELAAGYKVSDKPYYDEFIAPYYRGILNPIKGTGGMKIFIFCMAIFMSSMAILAFVVLSQKGVTFDEMFLFKDDPDETEVMYETVTINEKTTTSTSDTVVTTEKKKFSSTQQKQIDELVMSSLKTDLERGFYFFGMENYDMAEEYLEKIPKGHADYSPAQDVLKKISKKRETNPRSKRIEKIN